MNNKPGRSKKLQPDTSAEGDSSINTKKGFLISLPNRKKKSNEESGIVPAKTVSSPSHERTEKDNRTDKNASVARPASPPKDTADRNSAQSSKNQQNHSRPKSADNASKPDKRNDRPQGEKNARSDKNKTETGDKNAQNPSNDPNRRDNRDKSGSRGTGKNPGSKDNGSGKENRDAKNVENRSGRGNAKDTRKDRNDRKNDRPRPPKNEAAGRDKFSDRTDTRSKGGKNGKNERGDRKGRSRMPSLSPLSGDMMSFSASTERAAEKRIEKEPSFEEKYANAVPLAEQIAAEEAKRLARIRACNTAAVTHKVSPEQADAPTDSQAVKHCEIVGIRFREAGKIYYFDPDGQNIPYGTPVVVETSRGAEYGYTAIANRTVPIESVVAPLKKIKRLADRDDTDKYRANKELEGEAAVIFKQKVRELKLAMNLVFVEYTFDNSKLLFYFTAETRIDFRELVKELASIFRTRIELRQIGVRDEAKMLGGLGVCGRTVCCNAFLDDFAQVSIKMAKEQGLSLNSTKISGACGKLMCCLRFEDKVYSEETARTPRVGSVVETREGRGTVVETNPLKGEVKVSLENTPDAPPKTFSRDEVKHPGHEKNAEATAAKAEHTDKPADGEQA